jgi:TonB family protein
MKTKRSFRFILISAATAFFFSYQAYAGTPANECASRIWQKFQSGIKYPEFAHKQAIQGEVIVVFTVSDDGKIIVKDVRSTDTELGKYVRSAMSEVKCPELQDAGVYDFKVKFHFRLI